MRRAAERATFESSAISLVKRIAGCAADRGRSADRRERKTILDECSVAQIKQRLNDDDAEQDCDASRNVATRE